MCNLYAIMRARAEAAALARAMTDRNNNQPPIPGVYPDYLAPVILKAEDGSREMRDLRWGMPSSKQALFKAASDRADKLRVKGKEVDFTELLKMEPDKGSTNVRNTTNAQGKTNAHWRPWLGPPNRCLVPFTSFAEPDQDYERTRKNIWFALDDSRPLAFFAGIWTPHACVRMISKGWEEIEAFGFLTTDSAEPVKTYHAKAMPVILLTEAERDLWMSDASWEEVKHLQRPLPPGTLKVVGQGDRKDDTPLI
ncbi:SOS response-associated peptidase family protein [Phenylobacterium montanum]|uniref:Abasic site processing protein n=1 Tax=Phenylobacterium montanum TaxID=2823693 RepID=A0A975ITY9_9CAUL|nr:SOS response-associated peptidase family protein [Caulobacter sp. S6]QUD86969.1 SOS response-associated peptidase family protein [Caulobacter sp. S6]